MNDSVNNVNKSTVLTATLFHECFTYQRIYAQHVLHWLNCNYNGLQCLNNICWKILDFLRRPVLSCPILRCFCCFLSATHLDLKTYFTISIRKTKTEREKRNNNKTTTTKTKQQEKKKKKKKKKNEAIKTVGRHVTTNRRNAGMTVSAWSSSIACARQFSLLWWPVASTSASN